MSVVLVTLLASVYLSSADEYCRCLALEGGGTRGAFEAGAVLGLAQTVPEEVQWDYISGVSTGALNVGYFSMYPKGKELEMASDLIKNVWLNLKGHFSLF